VFSLLVQQKSTDIVCKKDEQNWKSKVRIQNLIQVLCLLNSSVITVVAEIS